MTQIEEKPWYKSNTKLGAVVIGVAAVLGTLGRLIVGTIPVDTGIYMLLTEVGGVLFIFGVRNMPFINRK